MFKKNFLVLGLIISGFNFCAAMENSEQTETTANSNVSK